MRRKMERKNESKTIHWTNLLLFQSSEHIKHSQRVCIFNAFKLNTQKAYLLSILNTPNTQDSHWIYITIHSWLRIVRFEIHCEMSSNSRKKLYLYTCIFIHNFMVSIANIIQFHFPISFFPHKFGFFFHCCFYSHPSFYVETIVSDLLTRIFTVINYRLLVISIHLIPSRSLYML